MRHIIICGERQVGKSTLIEKLRTEISVPVYGVITKIMRRREDGFHEIYMFSPSDTERKLSDENHLADCDSVNRTVSPVLFETLGVELLRARKPDGIVILDELGFMEARSEHFCREVMDILDGEIPVIAAVKKGFADIDFLNHVKNHPKADLYIIDSGNRDELYLKLLPVVREWNETIKNGGLVK